MHWVEFVQDGVVHGRELAAVVTPAQADRLNRTTRRPEPNEARIDVVSTNFFLRIWINHGQCDYMANLPIVPTTK